MCELISEEKNGTQIFILDRGDPIYNNVHQQCDSTKDPCNSCLFPEEQLTFLLFIRHEEETKRKEHNASHHLSSRNISLF